MKILKSESVDLIYLDPPFNTGKVFKNTGGEFNDKFGSIEHYIGWMKPRIEEMHKILKPTGSIYLHCDWHASHYLKIVMDEIFGINNFQNEIIWHYTNGGAGKTKFSRKHDNIFFYSKSKKYTFNHNDVRTPYKPQNTKIYHDDDGIYMIEPKTGKRRYYNEKGKVMDDVWDINFIGPNSKERLGWPTQKPETLLERIIKASSNKGDVVFDPFCGCGTSVFVAKKLVRKYIGIDMNPKAIELTRERLKKTFPLF